MMTPHNHSSNTPKQHHLEAATIFNTHEMVANRISVIVNNRERLHIAIPLPKELQPSAELIQSAAEHAAKMLQQTASVEAAQDDAPTAQVYQFPEAEAPAGIEEIRRSVSNSYEDAA